MLQEAVIPKWVPRALLGLVVAAWASVILWALVLKPTVKSTAKEAANDALAEPLREASAQIAGLAALVGAPKPPPLVPGGSSGEADEAATTTTTGPAVAEDRGGLGGLGGLDELGTPRDGRLEATPEAQTVSYKVPAGEMFSLTDIFLQNPQGDSGLLRVQRGTTTLLTVRLDNFRDLDYHFVSPMVFAGGENLTLAVECANPAPATPDSCTPAATYNGFIRPAPPAPPA
jgi:hypothetical protein